MTVLSAITASVLAKKTGEIWTRMDDGRRGSGAFMPTTNSLKAEAIGVFAGCAAHTSEIELASNALKFGEVAIPT